MERNSMTKAGYFPEDSWVAIKVRRAHGIGNLIAAWLGNVLILCGAAATIAAAVVGIAMLICWAARWMMLA